MALGAAIGKLAGPEWKNRKIEFQGRFNVEAQKCRAAGKIGRNSAFLRACAPGESEVAADAPPGPIRAEKSILTTFSPRSRPFRGQKATCVFSGSGQIGGFRARPRRMVVVGWVGLKGRFSGNSAGAPNRTKRPDSGGERASARKSANGRGSAAPRHFRVRADFRGCGHTEIGGRKRGAPVDPKNGLCGSV